MLDHTHGGIRRLAIGRAVRARYGDDIMLPRGSLVCDARLPGFAAMLPHMPASGLSGVFTFLQTKGAMLAPAALANDMMALYAPSGLCGQQVTTMELLCASV